MCTFSCRTFTEYAKDPRFDTLIIQVRRKKKKGRRKRGERKAKKILENNSELWAKTDHHHKIQLIK